MLIRHHTLFCKGGSYKSIFKGNIKANWEKNFTPGGGPVDSVNVKPGGVFLWAGGYFGILLLCAFLDVAVWRKLFPGQAHILSLATETVSFLGFVLLLIQPLGRGAGPVLRRILLSGAGQRPGPFAGPAVPPEQPGL